MMARMAWLAGALALVVGSAAQAQGLRWQTRQSPDGVILAYEQPDTDFQPVFVMCRLPGRRLSVRIDPPRGMRVGEATVVEFVSEGGQAALRMRVEQSDPSEPIVMVGETAFDPAFARVLRDGMTLRVIAAGRTERYPLIGARPGATRLATACGG